MKKARSKPYPSISEAYRARGRGGDQYSSETREKVKKMYLETTMTQAEMAKELGVHQTTVSHHLHRLLELEKVRERRGENIAFTQQMLEEADSPEQAAKRRNDRLAAHAKTIKLKP
jgi:transposase-like protein